MAEKRVCPTLTVAIWIAGDYARAVQACREFCMGMPLCVTVTPTDYVYVGGMESGVRVGLMNYPRFPESLPEISAKAEALAEFLRVALCQSSYSIEHPHETAWVSHRKER